MNQRITIFGGRTRLGGYLREELSVQNKVQVLSRPAYDLLDRGTIIPAVRATQDFETTMFILNAFSHDDVMAQGRWFEELSRRLFELTTLVVIGSFAYHFPVTTSMIPSQLAYREGKRYLHDVFIRQATNSHSPRILLLEPGTIRHDGWPVPLGAEKTNYLKPVDALRAIEVFDENPALHHSCWTVRGQNFPIGSP